MQGNLSTVGTRSRRTDRIDAHDFTASIYSFDCEMRGEQTLARIKNALGQVTILHHVADT
jgi:hypothetical protein